jgi:hypothetical protein
VNPDSAFVSLGGANAVAPAAAASVQSFAATSVSLQSTCSGMVAAASPPLMSPSQLATCSVVSADTNPPASHRGGGDPYRDAAAVRVVALEGFPASALLFDRSECDECDSEGESQSLDHGLASGHSDSQLHEQWIHDYEREMDRLQHSLSPSHSLLAKLSNTRIPLLEPAGGDAHRKQAPSALSQLSAAGAVDAPSRAAVSAASAMENSGSGVSSGATKPMHALLRCVMADDVGSTARRSPSLLVSPKELQSFVGSGSGANAVELTRGTSVRVADSTAARGSGSAASSESAAAAAGTSVGTSATPSGAPAQQPWDVGGMLNLAGGLFTFAVSGGYTYAIPNTPTCRGQSSATTPRALSRASAEQSSFSTPGSRRSHRRSRSRSRSRSRRSGDVPSTPPVEVLQQQLLALQYERGVVEGQYTAPLSTKSRTARSSGRWPATPSNRVPW